jgi:hypothetical protein
VDATYTTIFLRIVGVSTIDLRRAGAQPLAVATIQHVLPFAVCKTTAEAQPLGPWTIWHSGGSLCGVAGWSGLIDLDGTASDCNGYYSWIGPPLSGPPPDDGGTARLDTTHACSLVPSKALLYTGLPQSIVVVDASTRTVLGCRSVLVIANVANLLNLITESVTGTPVGPLLPCAGILQTE